MTRHRFSNLDTLLLRMDNPADPVVVTGMLVLGAPLDMERLKAIIETRILRFDRLRQRVVPSRLPWRTPYWKDDVGVDLDYHVQRVILPPPGDQAALQRTVSVLVATPLDMDRPPWQMHLVETYGSGSVLICRAHHSLADGVALVHVILSLADADAMDPPSVPEQEDPPHGPDVIQRPQGRTRGRPVRRLMRRGLRTLGHLRRVPELAQWARERRLMQAISYYRRRMPIRLSGACQVCPRALPGRSQSRWRKSRPLGSGWTERSTTCCSQPWQARCSATCGFGRTAWPTLVFVRLYPSTGARWALRRNWAIESRRFFSLCP